MTGGMISEEYKKRWRAALEVIGAPNVSQRLNGIDQKAEAEVRFIGNGPLWPSRGFVESWLREHREQQAGAGFEAP